MGVLYHIIRQVSRRDFVEDIAENASPPCGALEALIWRPYTPPLARSASFEVYLFRL